MHEFETDSPWPQPDRLWLDRLIDGEITPVQTRELLARLDHEPDGWRRLALGFLEAQVLRRELGEIAAPRQQHEAADTHRAAGAIAAHAPPEDTRRAAAAKPLATPPGRVVAAPAKPASGLALGARSGVETVFAIAASFILAFGLGVLVRDRLLGPGPGPDLEGAAQTANLAGSPTSTPSTPSYEASQALSASAGDALPAAVDLVWTSDGPRAKPVQLPVVEPEELIDHWIDEAPPSLSPEAERALSLSGHRLARLRQLWPVTLEDGQVAEVPVEQVQIRFVADDYQ